MDIALKAKQASQSLRSSRKEERDAFFDNLVNNLKTYQDDLINENKKDLSFAKEQGLSEAIIDRLKLDKPRIENLVKAVIEIKNQVEVVGQTTSTQTMPNGLLVKRERVPLGVILMIFESRPNVIIDASCLAIKSGNSIILKGGKEAYHSNMFLGEIIKRSIENIFSLDSVQVLASNDKEIIKELLLQNKYIDLVIPRGGENLIKFVYENSKIPVIAHYKGVCHIYIDEYANLDIAIPIVINAKVSRPAVCNACETLLLHQNLPSHFIKDLIVQLKSNKTEIRVCNSLFSLLEDQEIKLAITEDWNTEYLDNILSIKLVETIDEAISHINKYGSLHTEAIVSDKKSNLEKFQKNIDASCIVFNASTRFNDGGELGLGAEIGISTSKIHSFGPMGASGLTIERFVVEGNGHIR